MYMHAAAAAAPAPALRGSAAIVRRATSPAAATPCTTRRRSRPRRAAAVGARAQQQQQQQQGGDWAAQGWVRSVPVGVGVVGGATVVANRLLQGLALASDASTAQSRADVLTLAAAATLASGMHVLTGLSWISVRPRTPVPVQLTGVPVRYIAPDLTPAAQQEVGMVQVLWAWHAISQASRAASLVVAYRGQVLLHAGLAGVAGEDDDGWDYGQREPVIAQWGSLSGAICRRALETGAGNYLPNLSLYSGKREFAYFPENTQAVVVTCVGEDGLLVVASDTPRGFSRVDQAWLSTIADKLDSTLQSAVPAAQTV
eukprot:jgi/Chlat1/218/Chrsp1S03039